MSVPYSPYGVSYPPMPTEQYGPLTGAEGEVAPYGSPYATQYPPMPIPYTGQAMTPPALPSTGGHTQMPPQAGPPPVAMPPQAMPPQAAPRQIGPPVAGPPGGGVAPPAFLGPPTTAGGTGVVPRPRMGPPIAAYGPPGGGGQPAGYGPRGPADPSVFVHPGQGNRDQFGSGLAATSPGPDVSDGGGDPGAQNRLGGRLLPAAPPAPGPRLIGPPVKQPPGSVPPPAFLGPPTAGGGVPPRQIGPPVQQPPGTSFVGPPTAKPPASVPNGATPVVGG